MSKRTLFLMCLIEILSGGLIFINIILSQVSFLQALFCLTGRALHTKEVHIPSSLEVFIPLEE